MLYSYQKRKLKQSRFFYFSLSLFFVSLVSAASWNIYKSYADAPSSSLICNTDESRTISVGEYVDSSGDTFTSGSVLDLSAADGPCTFVLTQSESDSAIDLQGLEIHPGVTLTHATSTASVGTYNKIHLNVVNSVIVDGYIDVSGKGYLGGYQEDNNSDLGQGFGNENLEMGGGSHGGQGGNGTYGVYDSITQPSLPGSGGAANSDTPGDEGGNGGGVIIISAAAFSGEGIIYANGGSSIYGGGAGGTISLDANGGNISVSGVMAYGGNTVTGNAGGGGRISLRNYEIMTSMYGAPGGFSDDFVDEGAAGTLFELSNSAVYGNLVIANIGVTSATYATTFPSLLSDLDIVAEYGDALVFDSIEVSSGGILNVSSNQDFVSDGSVDPDRRLYVSDCPVDDDDLSNGEIIYNHGFAAGGELENYICVAPQRVVGFNTGLSAGLEGVTSVDLTVELQGPTSQEVSVDIEVDEGSTTASWNGVDFSTSTVTVIIPEGATTGTYSFDVVDDASVEETESINFDITGALAAVIDPDASSHFYDIEDNDGPALLVTESDESTILYKPDTADSFEVRLQSVPTDIVTTTLELAYPDQITLSAYTLVFTPENWNVAQVVTATPIDVDLASNVDLTITPSSNDLGYDALLATQFSLSVVDNDQLVVTETDGSTLLEEEGVTFDVINYELIEEIIDSVVVTVTTTDENILLSTSTLYFNAENWNESHPITYTVVDDDIDNDRDVNITYTMESVDMWFNNANIPNTTISVTDTDVDGPAPGIILEDGDNGTVLYEPNVSATYTVKLATLPTSDVTVTLSLAGGVENIATLSVYSLVFTTDNWDVAQTVTLSPDDDEIANDSGTHVVTHTVSSSDGDYDILDPEFLNFVIVDDDQITLTETDDSTVLAEEGVTTDTIDYVLEYAPTEDVVIHLTSSDDTVTLSTSTLYFHADDSDEAQTVTFTVTDDDVDNDRDAYITYTVDSDDPNFDGAHISTTTISVTDTDTIDIGITVSAISRHTTEGGQTATFTVELESEPTDDVVINLSSSDTGEGTVSPDTLTFTAADWNEEQIVTVRGVNDSQDDGDIAYMITFDSVTSDDDNYQDFEIAAVDVVNDDNDSSHGGGGGGGVVVRPTTDSNGNKLYSLKIENDAAKTSKTKVNLSFAGNDIQSIAVSNFENFAGVSYVPFAGNMNFDLLPGPGIKTVYVKVQTNKGIVYNISDTIELTGTLPDLSVRPNIPVANTANCLLTAQKAYKSPDSPRVYMIHKYTNTLTGDRCTKEYLGSPLHFFSYFRTWGDVEEVDASVLNSIPDDAFASPVLGPRFIPYNGSIVRTLENEQAYYIMNGAKYLLSGDTAFRHMGFDKNWLQTVNTEVLNGFKNADTITATSPWPAGLVINFTSIPSRAYQVIETTKDNKVRVKDLGLIEKMDDKLYRRDRVVRLERNINVLLPTGTNVQKVTLTRFLKLGSTGPDVRYLQAKLQSLGYFTYESATGRYGYETVRAVERFQKDHGIDVKGYVGPGTRSLINSL